MSQSRLDGSSADLRVVEAPCLWQSRFRQSSILCGHRPEAITRRPVSTPQPQSYPAFQACGQSHRSVSSHFLPPSRLPFRTLASITFVALSIVLTTRLPTHKTDSHLSSLAFTYLFLVIFSCPLCFFPAPGSARLCPALLARQTGRGQPSRFTTVSLNNMFECACLLLPPASCFLPSAFLPDSSSLVLNSICLCIA
jgi:hypothetical protein